MPRTRSVTLRVPSVLPLAIAAGALPASGAITATSSGIGVHPASSITYPPVALSASMQQGVAWNEQTNVPFAGSLDFWPALGNSQTVPSSFPTIGPVQTDGHYVYFDHFSVQGWGSSWMDFSNPILGVLFTDQSLFATNPTHGVSGATGWQNGTQPMPPQASLGTFGYFNTWGGHEGWVWMSASQPNRLYIELPFSALGGPPIWPQDTVEMRILTATPAPGAGALLGAAGILAARRRRAG